MANILHHEKAVQIADGPDITRVRPSDWNAPHVFAGGAANGQCLVWRSAEPDNVTFAHIVPAGSRALWDQDSAPLGWTRQTDVDDRVVRLVAGARAHGGSWTIGGLTHSHFHPIDHTHGMPHTHAGATHDHGVGAELLSGTGFLAQQAGGVNAVFRTDAQTGTTGNTNTANTGGASPNTSGTPNDVAVASDGSWRPLHRDMIVASKDAV